MKKKNSQENLARCMARKSFTNSPGSHERSTESSSPLPSDPAWPLSFRCLKGFLPPIAAGDELRELPLESGLLLPLESGLLLPSRSRLGDRELPELLLDRLKILFPSVLLTFKLFPDFFPGRDARRSLRATPRVDRFEPLGLDFSENSGVFFSENPSSLLPKLIRPSRVVLCAWNWKDEHREQNTRSKAQSHSLVLAPLIWPWLTLWKHVVVVVCLLFVVVVVVVAVVVVVVVVVCCYC